MMFLDDVIARLDGLREEHEREARRKGASPEWRRDAEALEIALSLLREYRTATQQTQFPAEILWITPERVRGLRNLLGQAQRAALSAKGEAARTTGLSVAEQKAAEAVSALTRAEILMREVDKHGHGEN